MKKKSIEYIFNKIIGVNNEKICDEVNCNKPGITKLQNLQIVKKNIHFALNM